MSQKINLLLLSVFTFFSLSVEAKDDVNMMKLQAEMLRLISTPEREQFYEVTEQLKSECQKQGDERLFYTAWGIRLQPMQAIRTATGETKSCCM